MFENVCQSVADYKNCVKDNNRNNLVKACRNLSAGLFYMDVHYRREIYKVMENKQAYGLLEEERPKAKMIGEDGNIFNWFNIFTDNIQSLILAFRIESYSFKHLVGFFFIPCTFQCSL